MPSYIKCTLGSVLFLLVFIPFLSAQADSSSENIYPQDDNLQKLLLLLKKVQPIDINRLPINICFFTDSNEHYVGFIIAGHAYKSVCQVASMAVRHLLDSLGYNEQSIFSFGVGFDYRSDSAGVYDILLHALAKVFYNLEAQDIGQVSVRILPYYEFESKLQSIRQNCTHVWAAMDSGTGINRVIFRYHDVGFPIMTPFYTS